MSQDPYHVLGVPEDASDEAIRQRYLDLVKRFSPEHHPAKFAELREAFELLRDENERLKRLIFSPGRELTIGGIIEELACQMEPTRAHLKTLIDLARAH